LGQEPGLAVRVAGPRQSPDAPLRLEGELSQHGEAVTMTARLVDRVSGAVSWSQRFTVRADELFSVEDVIAERVSEALRLRVAASQQGQLRRRYTSNAPAYADYLHGRAAMAQYTPDGTRQAAAAFERALQGDPEFTLARAGLAAAASDMYLRFAPAGDPEGWAERAEREARAALEMDPDLAEAHLARAAVARKREFDWETAMAASRRALVLNPTLDQAHFFIAAAYYHLGYMEEALLEMERGRRLGGPDVVEPLRIEALVALFSGRFAPAVAQLEEVSRRSSQPIGDTYLALGFYYSGNAARAEQMLEALSAHQSASTASRAGVSTKSWPGNIAITTSPMASVPPTRNSAIRSTPCSGCAPPRTAGSPAWSGSNAIRSCSRCATTGPLPNSSPTSAACASRCARTDPGHWIQQGAARPSVCPPR
jgi:tetratricopeptide (TPR) repeat protein